MKHTYTQNSELPFALEGELERTITADPQWLAGIAWGLPRAGHPEGQVALHIRELLALIDANFGAARLRPELRLVALIHDTFKYQAAMGAPGQPRPTHGLLARRFAQRYIADQGVLEVIELHDEAYKIWRALQRDADAAAAGDRARALLARLGQQRTLFMSFYRCDCQAGDKSSEHFAWFERIVNSTAYTFGGSAGG